MNTVKSIMERNGIMVSVANKSDFDSKKFDLVQGLNKLLKFSKGQQENANALPELNQTLACNSLSAVIKYLDLCNDPSYLGQFKFLNLNISRYVHMDNAAVSALNIFPKQISNNINTFKYDSILGVLDRCRTAQGNRLMMQWLKQPLRDLATIKDRHDIVECFVANSSIRNDLHDDYLKRMPDLMNLIKKIMRKKSSLQDIYKIYQVVARIPKLLSLLEMMGNTTIESMICDPLKICIEVNIFLKINFN